MSYEGKILANTILSEGSPDGWNPAEVIKIGILSQNKINETKLNYFYGLASTSAGYNNTRQKFDISYDYYFYLNTTLNINGVSVDGIGKPGINRSSGYEDVKNLVKVTRYTVYKNKPMTAYFYIWEG